MDYLWIIRLGGGIITKTKETWWSLKITKFIKTFSGLVMEYLCENQRLGWTGKSYWSEGQVPHNCNLFKIKKKHRNIKQFWKGIYSRQNFIISSKKGGNSKILLHFSRSHLMKTIPFIFSSHDLDTI